MKGSEIQNLDFNVNFLGYKKSDVRACLREISEYVLRLEEKVYELEIERNKLKDNLNKTEIGQSNLKDMMLSVQEFKNKVELEAKEQATEIVNKAKKQYQEISSSIRSEKLKLNMVRKEVESVINTITEKLKGFKNMIENKENNIHVNETMSFENEYSNFFGRKKFVKIENDENNKNESTTLEFNTSSEIPAGEDYIKSKFKEIDLR